MIGTILSSMAFSGAFILGVACIRALFKTRKGQQAGHNFRYFTVYVVLMVSISTFSEIESILTLLSFTFRGFVFSQLESGSPMALPLAVWGADGFMVSSHQICIFTTCIASTLCQSNQIL